MYVYLGIVFTICTYNAWARLRIHVSTHVYLWCAYEESCDFHDGSFRISHVSWKPKCNGAIDIGVGEKRSLLDALNWPEKNETQKEYIYTAHIRVGKNPVSI